MLLVNSKPPLGARSVFQVLGWPEKQSTSLWQCSVPVFGACNQALVLKSRKVDARGFQATVDVALRFTRVCPECG